MEGRINVIPDIENMINGRWQNIINVRRLGTHQTIDPMSVAEHSWLVAMLCMQFFQDVVKVNENVWVTDQFVRLSRMANHCVQRALIHDLEESLIGDIPRISCIYEEASVVKETAINNMIEELFDGNKNRTDFSIGRLNCKKGVEGSIVSYFDTYSLLIEEIREMKLGNQNLNTLVSHTLDLLSIPVKKEFDNMHTSYAGNIVLIEVVEYLCQHHDKTQAYIKNNYGIAAQAWQD